MNKRFISINPNIKSPFKSTSLLLRRSFNIKDINHKFYLEAIGLGIAVYYLNGQRITDSVLNTTNSDYSKTLYLDRFDITNLIRKGRNVIAIELGNGFYNESLETYLNSFLLAPPVNLSNILSRSLGSLISAVYGFFL